jgi:hypothetical protein
MTDKPYITSARKEFGFGWGALDVERTCSDVSWGWVIVTLKTPKRTVEVYVTKTGKMRLFDKTDGGREL